MSDSVSLTQSTLRVISSLDSIPGLQRSQLANGATVIDCGVKAPGSLSAGLMLARVCLAGRADVRITQGAIADCGCTHIEVTCDDPVKACLLSQYAGWQVKAGKYFGMGSGPMRAIAAREELFHKLNYREQAFSLLGVLEAGKLPNEEVADYLADRCGMNPASVTLFVAPTASIAGTIQVVARSVETSLHKLFELGFDMSRVQHGFGSAPLPPVAKDDLAGIGRTNDAILYGGRVTLWVTGDDDSLRTIGPKVPASAASCYGQPFLDIFKAADHDFYKIDPMLFSPAEVVFHNIETGTALRFGHVNPSVLSQSFGLS